ncbi:MAG: hypothetical protein J0H94_03950 [Rhizobiales bacterium]|nr:hypothetical protein [Hyphomicrobiales bacterium]
MRDMHNNISVVKAIKPGVVGTTGAANGTLSGIVDRKGFEAVEFVYQSGGSASVADTINPVVLEADATNGSFTSVADADLLGTEAALTLTTSAGKIGRVGYRGNKRYLKLRLYGLGTATAIVAATAILGKPRQAPVA